MHLLWEKHLKSNKLYEQKKINIFPLEVLAITQSYVQSD